MDQTHITDALTAEFQVALELNSVSEYEWNVSMKLDLLMSTNLNETCQWNWSSAKSISTLTVAVKVTELQSPPSCITAALTTSF